MLDYDIIWCTSQNCENIVHIIPQTMLIKLRTKATRAYNNIYSCSNFAVKKWKEILDLIKNVCASVPDP